MKQGNIIGGTGSRLGKLANIPDVLYDYRFNLSSLSNSNIMLIILSLFAAWESYRCQKQGKPDPLNNCLDVTVKYIIKQGWLNKRMQKTVALNILYRAAHTVQFCQKENMALELLQSANRWIAKYRLYSKLPWLWYYSAFVKHRLGKKLTGMEMVALVSGTPYQKMRQILRKLKKAFLLF